MKIYGIKINSNDYPKRKQEKANSRAAMFFKGDKLNTIKKYGGYAFDLFSTPKPIANKIEREKALESIINGAAILAAASSAVLAPTCLDYFSSSYTTSNMLSRMTSCYGKLDNKKNLIKKIVIGLNRGIFNPLSLKFLLDKFPLLGNVSNPVLTACLHEISGRAWMACMEEWLSSGCINNPDLKMFKKHLEYQEKITSLETMVNKYNTPEIQSLIQLIQVEMPLIVKNMLDIQLRLNNTSFFNIIKRKQLKSQLVLERELVYEKSYTILDNKLEMLIKEEMERLRIRQSLKVKKESRPVLIKVLLLEKIPLKLKSVFSALLEPFKPTLKLEPPKLELR